MPETQDDKCGDILESHDHQYCKNGHKEKHCNTIANCHSTNIASSLKRALHNVKYVIEEVDTALTTMREYEDIAWKLKEPLYEPDSVLTSQDEDVIRRARNTTIMSACGMALAIGVACNANGNIPGFLRGVFTLSAGCIGLFGAGVALTFTGKYNDMLLNTTNSRLADCACDPKALKPLVDCISKGRVGGEILSRTHYKSLIERCKARTDSQPMGDHWHRWRAER